MSEDECADQSVRRKFILFHTSNPNVLRVLRVIAAEMIRRGYDRLSISALWEVMRYEYRLVDLVSDDSGYKLNNTLQPYYARLLNHLPQFTGYFELRRMQNPLSPEEIAHYAAI